MLGTQIPSIQGFGASYYHMWHWNLGRRLEKLSLEGFQEDAYYVSCLSVFFNYLPYFVAHIWRISHIFICSQAYHGPSTMACPHVSLLASKSSNLTWLNKDLSPSTNRQPCGRHHVVYFIGNPMTTHPHQKIAYDEIKAGFLAME
jgi:hypothetical protein